MSTSSMEKISGSKSKVRVVRCPRCTKLLAEPSDVPLYACGGCATLLLAKHYKKENERRTISDHSDDAKSGNEPQSVSSSQDYKDTIDASFSNEIARLALEESSSSMDQLDEMVVDCSEAASSDTKTAITTSTTAKKMKGKSDGDSEAEISSTKGAHLAPKNQLLDVHFVQNESTKASNQELDVQVLQNESGGLLTEVESINETMDENSTTDVHVQKAPNVAENTISTDSGNEESYTRNDYYTTIQRTPPMLNVIEMPQRTRRGASGFSTSLMDDDSDRNRIHHQRYVGSGVIRRHTYYESSLEIYPHPRYLRYEDHDLYDTPHIFSDTGYYSSGYDTVSEDQRCQDDQERSSFHSRRKPLEPRRIWPMAGAAPFVTCYQCLELLELPSEFLMLKTRRRSYRVKCSTCSRNLEFAVVVDKGHRLRLVPFHGETEHARDEEKSLMVEDQRHEEDKRSGSPLHRLMGYATPSAMFDGYES